MKFIFLLLSFCLACAQNSNTKQVSDREHDEFIGPVKKVFAEWSPVYRSWDDGIPLGKRCPNMTKEYDENGRLLRNSVYPGSCGIDEIREDFTYAQDGSRTAKRTETRGKDSPPPPPPPVSSRPSSEGDKGQPREVFKYDSSGKRVEMASIRPSGKVSFKIVYTYDARGRLTESATYNGDSQNSQKGDRRVYGYTGDDRVPSSFTYIGRDDKIYEKSTYTDYEFNSHGDWVKRKETSELTFNRKSISWELRSIEYYPTSK